MLIDFEGAEHRHFAWDAAYLTVPWPTCWCAWRLPPELTAAALDTWRQTLGQPVPHVRTAAFDDELTRATLAWTWWSVGALLARTIDDDPPASVADLPGDSLPALRDLADATARATSQAWGFTNLPLAPAFR